MTLVERMTLQDHIMTGVLRVGKLTLFYSPSECYEENGEKHEEMRENIHILCMYTYCTYSYVR